jgi:hypothetical protein
MRERVLGPAFERDDLGSIHTGMRGADARPIIPLRERPDVKRGAHTPPISLGTATTVVRAGRPREGYSPWRTLALDA